MDRETFRSDTKNPIRGHYWWDWENNKDFVYDGEKWVEMNKLGHPEEKSRFSYRDIYSQGQHVYIWTVVVNGITFTGSESTIPKAYRSAKKEVKRYRKMERFLNPVAK